MPPVKEDIMEKKEEYGRTKAILRQIPEVNVYPKYGSKFRFPIYMTESLWNTSIDSLELSVRSYNCLKRYKINTIGALCERFPSAEDLSRMRNCGRTSVTEIMDHLFAYQYSVLKPDKQVKFIKRVIEMNVCITE